VLSKDGLLGLAASVLAAPDGLGRVSEDTMRSKDGVRGLGVLVLAAPAPGPSVLAAPVLAAPVLASGPVTDSLDFMRGLGIVDIA
jgi:hypothetical protein